MGGLGAAQVAIAIAVALPSAFIRGLSGFGMALMLVPVLALTVSPVDAVLTVTMVGTVLGAANFRSARVAAEPTARIISILAVVFTPVGLALLSLSPPDLSRVLIALVALAAFVIVILPKPAGEIGAGPMLSGATGAACGLCAGFAGMPGPPVIAFYLGRKVDKAKARASMFVIFLATSVVAVIAATAMGILTARALWLSALLLPAVLLGDWLGSLAFGRVSDTLWRIVAGSIVAGAAAMALWQVL